MRLLLIEPPPPFDPYRHAFVAAPLCPTLTLGSLAGTARDAGHRVRVLDLRVERDPDTVFLSALSDFRPDWMGFSAFTFNYRPAIRLAETARRVDSSIRMMLGGIHAQVVDDKELADLPFDAVAMGEGEQTLLEILAGQELSEVAGLRFRENGAIRRTSPRPLLENLDALSIPAYELFDLRRYGRKQWLWKKGRIAMVESSRGCPFQCAFCGGGAIFGRRWRAKSPRRVIGEIARLLDLGFEEIHFQDDGFTTDLERAKDICRLILSSGRRFPWELYNGIRADRADEEFMALAARAGCYRLRFGVESGDQEVLRGIGKDIPLARVRDVYRWARRYEIETIALFMLGLPGETPATMAATTRFALELPCDFARVSITIPTPGSPLFAQWKKEDRILSADWNDYHFHHTSRLLFRHPTLTAAQVQAEYRRFYRRFYLRPRYWRERLAIGIRRGTLWRDFLYFARKFLGEPLRGLFGH